MTTNRQRYKYLFLLFAWLTTMSLQAQDNGDIVGPGIDDPTLTHIVTVTCGIGGTVTPVGYSYNSDGTSVTVMNDSKPEFLIEAHDGYRIASIAVTEGDAASGLGDMTTEYHYTFSKGISKDATLSVTFAETHFTLLASVKDGKGGTITPTMAVVPRGGNQTFTITTAEGFRLEKVADNGSDVTAAETATGASYTLNNIQEAHVIETSFRAKEYAVTIVVPLTGGSLAVKNGTTIISSGGQIAHGTVLTLEATPAAGYELAYFTVGGNRISGSNWRVTSAVTLGAVFKKKVLTVTVGIPQQGGTFTVAKNNMALLPGQHQMEYGTQLTLSNQPATGYTFAKYVMDGADITSSTYKVEKNVEINAIFIAAKYTVTVTSATGGTLTFGGQPASTADYDHGTVIRLGNTPSAGKIFDSYTVSPSSALNGNLLTVTGAVSVGISFKDIPGGSETQDPDKPSDPDAKLYKVTFPSSLTVMNNGVAISSGTMVKANTVLSLIAANTNTQQLKSLTANGSTVDFFTSGGMNTALHTVTGAVEFACTFTANEFPVYIDVPTGGTLSATAGGAVVVSGAKYPYGTVIRAEATPVSSHYKLSRILGNGRDITQSKQVTLTEDLLLSAIFTSQPIVDPDKDPDPSNPTDSADPSKPANPAGTIYIDRTLQQVIYNGNEQAYFLITLPGGVLDQVTVTYLQNGTSVRPKDVGTYDVRLTRAADDRFQALDVTLPGIFTIQKAPVTITEVKYDQTPWSSIPAKTTATLKEVIAQSQGKIVSGAFVWEAGGKKELEVAASSYQPVAFTPADTKNYQTPVQTQVYIQVGTTPAITYTLTLQTEGSGTISAWNGSMHCDVTKPFNADQVISVKATPAEGYRLKGFREEGAIYSLYPYEVIMTKNRTVTAIFEKKQNPSNPADPNNPSDPSTGLGVTLTPPASLVYDGNPKQVSVTSTPTVSGWQVTYRNNAGETVIPVDAGDYTVTVTRAEDDTYAAYQRTLTYTIQKATPAIEALPSASPVPTGAPLSESVLSGGIARVTGLGIVAGLFEWQAPATNVLAEGDQIFRFIPVDAKNINSVMGNTKVSVIAGSIPIPIRITYTQAAGGHLNITYEEGPNAGSVIASGALVLAGTKIRIQAKANTYFSLKRLQIGEADFTAEAINGGGTIVQAVYVSKEIQATFIQTSNPPDPVDPDKPGPGPDDPDYPNDPDNPDPGPGPTPTPSEFTVWVHATGLGSISPGTTTVKRGGTLTFKVIAGKSQQIVDVRVNGNSVGAVSSYILRNITSDMTVEAVFSQIGVPVYTLTSKVIGKGGCITPTKVRVWEGSNHQFILHTEQRGVLENVQVGTEKSLKSVGKPMSYIFRSVKADSLIVATFSMPTSIEEVVVTEVPVYVSGGMVHVGPLEYPTVLRVYTLVGRLWLQKSFSAGSFSFSLPEGGYLIEVENSSFVFRRKIWIRH